MGVNIFSEPKELMKWAIKLANELGGQKVEKTPMLVSFNMNKVDELVEEFVKDFNFHMVAKEEQETAVFQGKDIVLEEE